MIESLLALARAILLAYECGATAVEFEPPEAPMWDVRGVMWALEVRGLGPCEPVYDYPCGLVVQDDGAILTFFPCRTRDLR